MCINGKYVTMLRNSTTPKVCTNCHCYSSIPYMKKKTKTNALIKQHT